MPEAIERIGRRTICLASNGRRFAVEARDSKGRPIGRHKLSEEQRAAYDRLEKLAQKHNRRFAACQGAMPDCVDYQLALWGWSREAWQAAQSEARIEETARDVEDVLDTVPLGDADSVLEIVAERSGYALIPRDDLAKLDALPALVSAATEAMELLADDSELTAASEQTEGKLAELIAKLREAIRETQC